LPQLVDHTFTILVPEDLAVTRALFVGELRKDPSQRLLEAGNGIEALKIFKSQRPDLVLLDIEMPGVNGYEVAAGIRAFETGGWTPIIFLSALARDPDILRGIEAGGGDYLIKPVRSTILGAKIRVMRRLLDTQRRLMELTKELNETNALLNRMVELDGLTQRINRRGFDRLLYQSIDRAAQEQQPLTLVLIDVDHFKLYNDHYGHIEGHECLRKVAALLREVCARDELVAARYGGEELVLILPKTSRSAAMTSARALMHRLAISAMEHAKSPVVPYVTISGGITTVVPDASTIPEGLLRRADEALYAAKLQGRNRFFSFELQMDTSEQRAAG
jgi:diguanylate cyclase (GGDEF)-like protein